MKKYFLILVGIVISLFGTHKKSAQPKDNKKIQKLEITRGLLISTTITLRRGTEVQVSRVKDRCYVRGFVDHSTILVELPDGTILPFLKNRIYLAPLRK